MNRTVIVTGATGFIGSRLIERLLNEGFAVRGVTRSLKQLSSVKNEKLSWIERDLSVEGLSNNEFKGADTVFHLAGYWRGTDDIALVASNELATINLLKSLPDNIHRVVFASTQMVYGNPNSLNVTEDYPLDGTHSAYSCSKLCAENWLKFFQKKKSGSYLVLRFTGFIEGGGLIDYMIDRAIESKPIELYGNGLIYRDYLPVTNGIDALVSAERSSIGVGFHEYNIGSGCAVSAYDLAVEICKETKSNSKVFRLPDPAIRSNFVFNISKAMADLRFNPDNLIEAVIRYARTRYSMSVVRS